MGKSLEKVQLEDLEGNGTATLSVDVRDMGCEDGRWVGRAEIMPQESLLLVVLDLRFCFHGLI